MVPETVKKQLRDQYIQNGCWGTTTFGQALEKWADRYGDHTALVDETGHITYREWNAYSNRFADYFRKMGMHQGDRVVIQLPNSVLFPIVCFAFFKLGVIPVLALMAHREREIGNFIRKTNAKGYILAEKHLGFSYRDMGERCIEETGCRLFFEQELQILKNEGAGAEFTMPEISSYETACLLVSGGTTGIPKLIPRTHADYLYDAETFGRVLELNETTRFLAAIPVAHNFAFANPGLIGTALFGGRTIMSRSCSADEILDLIEEEGATITAMVPSLLGVCAEMAEWDDPERFSSLKTVLAGGAPLTSKVHHLAEQTLGCQVRQVFGTAEGVNTITPKNMDPEEVVGCQGSAISRYDEILVVDEQDHVLSVNEYGELLLRGPYTILNYFESMEADREAFRADGFYRTGDKAYFDEKGFLHVCGRIREQINKSGEKIIPSELEEIIQKHPQVSSVAVIGIPDETVGDRICVCIVPNGTGNIPDLTALREYMLASQVAAYKLPDYVMEVSSVPLTGVGKPDKIQLLTWFNERRKNANV